MNSKNQLKNNCISIAQLIEDLDDFKSFFKNKVLQIEYKIDESMNFLGAELLIAYGGPTIVVHTNNSSIQGSWALDKFNTSYKNEKLENYIEQKYYKKFNSLLVANSMRRI